MDAQTHGRVHSRDQTGPKVEILGGKIERAEEVLTPLAQQLLASLHRRFNARRLELLALRAQRQLLLDDGAMPDFLPATAAVRAQDWRVSPVPADLLDRRVEGLEFDVVCVADHAYFAIPEGSPAMASSTREGSSKAVFTAGSRVSEPTNLCHSSSTYGEGR